MKNNFDVITPWYDRIGRLIFGNTLIRSQSASLSYIKEGDDILILGGGSGHILTAIDHLDVKVNITYIELSSQMIKLAQARQPFKNIAIKFINTDALQTQLPKADVVITNYFLDVFTLTNLKRVMDAIDQTLSDAGIWMCTDFRRTNSIFKNGLIKLMYLFFRLSSKLEGNKLQDFDVQFFRLNYKKIFSKFYFGNMIQAAVYTKNKELQQ